MNMKRLIKCILLTVILLNQSVLAECDFKEIKEVSDGYLYPVDCHIKVGNIVKSNDELKKASQERKKQAEKLLDSIKMKELALEKSDERMAKWRDETYNQHERLLKQQRYSEYRKWLYFGGGVGLTILSVFAAGQIK